MNIKNFMKNHKKEIIIGGTMLVIGGGILVFKTSFQPKPTIVRPPMGATFVPNKEMDTVDLFIGNGSTRNYLWVFDVGEAEGLAAELEDCLACLRPQG